MPWAENVGVGNEVRGTGQSTTNWPLCTENKWAFCRPLAHLAFWPEPACNLKSPGRADTRLHLGHSAILPPGSSMSQNHWILPCSASAHRDGVTTSQTALCAAVSPHLHRRHTRWTLSVQFSAGAHRHPTQLHVSHTTARHAGSPCLSARKWSSWSWHDYPPSTPEIGWSFGLVGCSLQRIGREEQRRK